MAQDITTQAQPIVTQAYWKIFPHETKHASTIASRVRDFTRVDPPKHFELNEEPQYLLDEVYMILFAIRVSTMEKALLVTYQLKEVARAWFNLWKESTVFEMVS